jgi:flavin reductase (DIM6/NTAB) family NADH-FMN oxidoreductase RutF
MRMKKDFIELPESMKNIDFYGFSWIDFVVSIPSPLFVVSTYKSNGKPNACLQSWVTFAGIDENNFVAVMASVNKNKHMYKSIKETGEMVLNFPSGEIYPKCMETIKNNDFDDDEITKFGLTVEKAKMVNAPQIKECFLNLECQYLWEKELVEGHNVVMCVKIVNVSMDNEYYNEKIKGRYGKTGYIYNIHNPINPETGIMEGDSIGIIEKIK